MAQTPTTRSNIGHLLKSHDYSTHLHCGNISGIGVIKGSKEAVDCSVYSSTPTDFPTKVGLKMDRIEG